MYTVCKEFSFSAAHQIRGHTGGCERVHGHNYRVRVHVSATALDPLGMVVDFADLKAMMGEILAPFDHRLLNDVPPFDARNTTAELLAEHVCRAVGERLREPRLRVARVEVWESDGAGAIYEPPEEMAAGGGGR
jgi:6-pyruvoyltetrahydropterin/6-carboxytetrahydropterin synthase